MPKSSASARPSAATRRKWTAAELARLRKATAGTELDALAREFGRTPISMRRMWSKLQVGQARQRTWSAADLHWLRRQVGLAAPAEMARTLGRSEREVRDQLAELRSATRAEPLTLEEVQEFKALYGTRTDEDLSLIFSRPLPLVQALARQLCLAKDKAFLRRHIDQAQATPMPRWDKAELKLLRRLYSTHSNLDIAQRLQRSVKSVVSKAYHMGLRKELGRLREMGRENVGLRHARAARQADA